MGTTLHALHELQEIETQLATIRRRRESKVKRVDNLKRQVATAEEKIETHRRTVRQKQMRQDELSLEVATYEQALENQKDALGKAKSNKTYAEILTAINTTKADNSKLESGVLQLMEEIQVLNGEGKVFEEELGQLKTKVASAEDQLAQYDESTREQREKLEASRARCAEHIPASALSMFSRVASRHDGEAMALVFKVHPKRDEYVCAGCNMKVTLEVVNTLHKSEEMQLCHSCGRVLYLETDA
ncbi:MAG: zinc ribbon domain-containing protein [Phycisphaerae bacterium]